MNKNSRRSGSVSGEARRIKRFAPPKNERELLQRKSEEAKAAMKKTAGEFASHLLGAANLVAWTRRYPLGTTGATALCGFLLVGPLNPLGKKHPKDVSKKTPGFQSETSLRLGLTSILLKAGLDLTKNVLTPILTEMLKTKTPIRMPRTESQDI